MVDIFPHIISAIIGAGGLAGIATLFKAITERKKVPVDITLASLGGAEKALLVMKTFLDEAEEKIESLKAEMVEGEIRHKAEIQRKDEEIVRLQEGLQALRVQFNQLASQLDRIQRQAEEVRSDNDNHHP